MSLFEDIKQKVSSTLHTDQSAVAAQNSDWLVDHSNYTDDDDNALDMLEVMHTTPPPH